MEGVEGPGEVGGSVGLGLGLGVWGPTYGVGFRGRWARRMGKGLHGKEVGGMGSSMIKSVGEEDLVDNVLVKTLAR